MAEYRGEDPSLVAEMHGERSRVSTLVLVYLSGIFCAALMTGLLFAGGATVWQMAVSALVFLDVGGGVVANFSTSTRQYYQDHAKLRVPFITVHALQPALLAAVFPLSLFYFLFVMAFTLGVAFTVNAVQEGELRQTLAALLTAVGISLSFLFTRRFLPSICSRRCS
jgi:hypothetical protein